MANRVRQAPNELRGSVVDLGWTGPPEESLPDLTNDARLSEDGAPLPRFPSQESVVSYAAPLRALDEQAHQNLHLLREAVGVSTPGTMPEVPHDGPTTPLFPIPPAYQSLPPRPDDSMSIRSLPPSPSLGQSLKQRVRFAGGEVPLWSLIAPLVVLIALGAAFASAAVNGNPEPVPSAAASFASPPEATTQAPPAPLPLEPSPAKAKENPKAPTQLERVAAGEPEAIKVLEAKAPGEVTAAEAFALAQGRTVLEQRAARELREKLGRDPGLVKDSNVLGDLRRFSESAETAQDALAAIANVPGPLSPDMLYEVWTSTPKRTSGTELARSLLYTKDVRAKASPALSIALDLRAAEKCEDARALLPKVTEFGDRRSLSMLAKLNRRYGCGATKRQDCYECLRSNKDLENAQKAVKARREPRPFTAN